MTADTPLYRGMNREELDREYNARGTVPDIAPFLEAYAALSAEARRDCEVFTDLAYGPSEAEKLDFFPAGEAGTAAPVFVFLHGGYWRLLSKEDSAFMAKPFVEAGIAVAAVDYALAPAVTLDEIVRQVRSAIAYLWHEAERLGIDRERIYVGGSSAGGHLGGMVLAGDWQAEFGVPDDVVAGGMLASGLFDLEPLRHCHVNEWMSLDEASVARNSTLFSIPEKGARDCPLIVTWGGSETSEFKRQSRAYAEAWAAMGYSCEAFEIADRNHFDIILDLADPDRELTKRVLAMIAGGESREG